jgi:flagellar motor switch protein FliN/FliY
MSDKDQVIKIFVENWTSVYNTILGRDVRITIDTVQKKSRREVGEILGQFQSYISLSYGDGESQQLVIALKNKLVSIIANLMIGLDTFEDEIGTDDRDAFKEAVNQMFSACQAPIKETLKLDMRFRNIAFVESVDAAGLPGNNNVEVWTCSIHLPEMAREKFLMVTPRGFGGVKETKKARIAAVPQRSPVSSQAAPTATSKYGYEDTNIELLLDVELPIAVRIGTTQMRLVDIMRLGLGSIIELEKMVDDPVEVLVNEKLVARGEVVVCDSNFAVRITEVETKAERIKSLA